MNKLLYIFFIVILTSGCVRQKDNSIQVQTQFFEQINYISNEIIEYEEKSHDNFVHDEIAENKRVRITLKRNSPINDKIIYVDRNVTKLSFFKVRIIEIEGLSQLESLDTIVFDKVFDLDNYFF